MSLLATPAIAAPSDDTSYVARVLELTNAERLKAGLEPVMLNAQLNDAATNYSQILASGTCFEHGCGPVPRFEDRATQVGYTGWSALGENIAGGYPTADAVVAGWMASPGHRANILSPRFTEMGVGRVTAAGTYGTYWAQEFGGRPGASFSFARLPSAPEAEQPPAPDDTQN